MTLPAPPQPPAGRTPADLPARPPERVSDAIERLWGVARADHEKLALAEARILELTETIRDLTAEIRAVPDLMRAFLRLGLLCERAIGREELRHLLADAAWLLDLAPNPPPVDRRRGARHPRREEISPPGN